MKKVFFSLSLVLVATIATYGFMLVRYFPELLATPGEFFKSVQKPERLYR